jgi:6-phosphofructokinase 1
VRSAIYLEDEVFGVHQGYEGLINDEIEPMSAGSVADIIHRGGTILQTSRSEGFKTIEGRQQAADNLRKRGIEHLVIIGGNGSLRGGCELSKMGINVIGIPATIDNDVPFTASIGFDTAVNTVLEAINRLRDTASSHGRIFVIEVMGRDCGEIALAAGLAGGAESILIPEAKTDINQVINKIKQGIERGKLHSIIIVAEGVYPPFDLRAIIEATTGHDTRVSILGHMQRGGTPTAVDRVLACCMGKAAVDLINQGQRNFMVGGEGPRTYNVPLEEVVAATRQTSLEICEIARMLSI